MRKLEKKLEILCRDNYCDQRIKLGFQKFLQDNNERLSLEVFSIDYKKKLIAENLIVDIFIKLGFNETDALVYWFKTRNEQTQLTNQYYKKPTKIRKDNKDTINYSNCKGASNRNKIRFPKKCRKTAWKRFWKLFPHLDGLKTS
jgi:hypothetical protein